MPDITEDNEEEEDAGAIQQAMLGLVHGKLSGLVGKSSGYIENLPVEVKKNVEALKGVQVKQIELQNQYKRECLELEKKVCVPFCGLSGFCVSFFEVVLSGVPFAWDIYISPPASVLIALLLCIGLQLHAANQGLAIYTD